MMIDDDDDDDDDDFNPFFLEGTGEGIGTHKICFSATLGALIMV